MDLQLRGKRALVTGSTVGIGLAAAMGLYRGRGLGHRQRPVGVDQFGQNLELHVAQVALGLQLLSYGVLKQAGRLGEREVGAHLVGLERFGHAASIVLRSRSNETTVTFSHGIASISKQLWDR